MIFLIEAFKVSNWEHYLAQAQSAHTSVVQLLEQVIEHEYQLRQDNARKTRLDRARIPEQLLMETFPFERQPNLNKQKLLNLYDGFDYLQKRQNILWIGPTGTGKTGLVTAFLIQAINRGYKGRFIAFPELIDLLYQSIADHTEAKVLKTFATYDLLLIDEIGCVEMEPVQMGLFFTLLHKRHKQKSTLITTNLGFEQWAGFLKNDQLTAALIDRLTENSLVIAMKRCVSLRTKL